MRSISRLFHRNLLTWANLSIVVIAITVTSSAQANEEISASTQRQLTCLAQNIYHEAGSESFNGKVAVAQVTVNRANNGKFPSTICGVVHQKTQIADRTICQFSWVCDPLVKGRRVYSKAWKERQEIARKVLLDGLRLESLGSEALYFHNARVRPKWGLARIDRIGGHTFYSGDKVASK
jgi:spore germination cell wall hydrolase CwlJ-like protein